MKHVGVFIGALLMFGMSLWGCGSGGTINPPLGNDGGLSDMDAGGGMTPVDAGGGMMPVDAGGGMMRVDAGGGMMPVDAGGGMMPVDAGGGMMPEDAGACVPGICGATDCGLLDDGCGGTIDCGGPCGLGASCGSDADCTTEMCLTEANSDYDRGHCTDYCRTDAECGAGAHCAYTRSYRVGTNNLTRIGLCMVDCVSDSDCRAPAYGCVNVDAFGALECTPVGSGAGDIGDPCDSHADCGGGNDGFCALENNGFRSGYCSAYCDSDTACGPGAHCSGRSSTRRGICVQDCTSSASCRSDGYACFDFDEDSQNECWVSATGMAAVGDACAGPWACTGGSNGFCATNLKDGYCVTTGCMTDSDCGVNAHCGTFGSDGDSVNICAPNCTSDTDCRGDGYACYDANGDGANECWTAGTGSALIGAACEEAWDCAGGARAFCLSRPDQDYQDGYCTQTGCTADGSVGCPSGSHCSIVNDRSTGMPRATGLCLKDCTVDAECRSEGYRCFDTGDIDMTRECAPAATGSGEVGAACRWLSDCAGDDFGVCLLDLDNTVSSLPDYPGGYCTILCGAGEGVCPVASTCQFDVMCTADCTAPTDCRLDDYTCRTPPFVGSTGNACWPR